MMQPERNNTEGDSEGKKLEVECEYIVTKTENIVERGIIVTVVVTVLVV